MDYSLSGSSVHGILSAGVLEWVATVSSRGSSGPRDQTWVSCIAGRFFTPEPPRKYHSVILIYVWGNDVVHLFICLLAVLISFFFFFLAILGLCCCTWAFFGCSEWCCSLVAVLWLLVAVASFILEHAF